MRIAIGMGVGMQRRASAPAASGTITIDTITYTRGAAGVAPTVVTTVSSTGTTTGTYTLWGVLAATAQTKVQIDASPNKFSITAAALADLDGTIDLGNSATDGVISAYITDGSGSPIVSDVVTETGVTYDSVAPAFASAEIGTVDATSLIVTFSKATYGSTSAADWDVQVNGSPATESAVAFTPGGTTVDITLGAAVVNGDTVTVAYTGTGLVGVDAEVVATFTAQSVTNNVSAGATPSFVVFDPTTWFNMNADGLATTTTTGFTVAVKMKVQSPLAANAYPCGNGFDTYVNVSSAGAFNVRIEDTGGTRIVDQTGLGSFVAGDEIAFIFAGTETDAGFRVGVNAGAASTLISAITTPGTATLRIPYIINALNVAGSTSGNITIDAVWAANEYLDVDTVWSDFFDASNNPTAAMRAGSTISTVAADFFESGNAAAWDARTGMLGAGTVVDA